MRGVLRQIVGDGEPRRLGADEDVLARADGRIVDQGAHGDVDEGAVADHRIEQRAARLAARVVAIVVAEIMSLSAPLVMRSLSRAMPANGLNAEPVARRQFEQWQFAA